MYGVPCQGIPSVTLRVITPYTWTTLFEPVLQDLLTTVLTPTETSPTSAPLDDTLWCIPWCFNGLIDSAFRFTLSPSDDSYMLSTQLQGLLVRAWLEAVREAHATCGYWSTLLTKLSHAIAEINTSGGRLTGYALHSIRADDTAAFVRHLSSMISQLPGAEDPGLSDCVSFMYLLDVVVRRAKTEAQVSLPVGDWSAFYEGIVRDVVPSLIRLFVKVRNWRLVDDPKERQINRAVSHILVSVMFILALVLDEPHSLADALSSGILSALFKHPRFPLEADLEQTICTLLRGISCLMAYPEVSKQFARD
ncbi:hypothetical protein AAF712_016316 [Marasmius tenuissimus]|uniref:Proteasome activator Blm10 mid region domain-containing protein n=1 Tax=Marasmius tenuissimus TaxID=585030 RepID=A0ABR2Z601_9AGAR